MLSKFSVKKPYTVLVGVILVIVLGVTSLMKMSADLLPDINLPYVVVMTTYVGASPETVETVVTSPVESAMATISNIEGINSISAENYSIVILEFAQTANMDSVSLDIREKLDQIESYWDDSVSNPIIMKLNPNMLPIMIAAVGVDGMDEKQVSSFVDEKIIPEIESIEGVASVSASGLIEENIHAVIRDDKIEEINKRIEDKVDEQFKDAYAQIDSTLESFKGMEDMFADTIAELNSSRAAIDEQKAAVLESVDMKGIITEDLVTTILSAQNFSMPAGYVEEGECKYLVRVGDKPENVDDLKNIPVMTLPLGDGEVITLGEVADIFTTDNAGEVYTNVNGKHGIMLTVQKQTGYSTGDVSDSINKKFDKLRDRYESVSLVPLMDQGIYIDLVMDTIFENVLVGALLAIIILVIFLRDIKPTLIIAISIPVSLITAIVCMYFSNVTLNIISLSGLALGVGMLVDNSIVVIENIYRLRGEGMDMKTASVEGAKEVAGAIFASTLTTVCVFLPIVFTEGITRQLFTDMGLTIAYSLLASLIVALTVVPAMASKTLKKVKVSGKSKKTGFYRGYEKFLRGCLKFKVPVILLVIALLVGSVWLELKRGTEFFPEMEAPQITVNMQIAENSDITDIRDASNTMVERISKMEDVIDVGAMASSSTLSLLGGQSASGEENLTNVSLYVTTKEDRELSSAELTDEIKKLASDLEGVDVGVETSMMDMSALGGSGITLQIEGSDLDTLYSLAEEATKILESTEGVAKVSSALDDSESEFRITVNKEKAIEKSITVAQVFATVYEKFQAAPVATKLTTATGDISVYLEKEEDWDATREALKNLEMTYTDANGEKASVKLKDICNFSETEGFKNINRKNQVRYIQVTASLKDGYNIGLVSKDAEVNMKQLQVPEGYSCEFDGENEMIMDALKQLALMLVLAVIFIYLIMVAQFQSLSSPFIIMFTIPLAFTGGLIALYIGKFELSIIAMIGMVMLSGIIVNNGIVLVDYINQRRADGLSKKEAIVDAGLTRIRPVLMTALTTILALFTMAFSTKMGSDMSRPLAIVVIGGMVYGTMMTLIVVPCVYDLFSREKKNKEAKA